MKTKNLRKIYKPKDALAVYALKDINVELPERGLVFIVGRSGSGKSTLLNLLSGLDYADEGHILLGDTDLCKLSPSQLDAYRNSCCGFVFQEYDLIPELNVEDNIALALEMQGQKDSHDEVCSVLERVGLKGYEKRKVLEMSGGQKQRVAIARAIVKDPKIVFADEPTGSLDRATGEDIFLLLKELSKDRLVIVVSHDTDSAQKYGDRVIELEDGRIIRDSSPCDTKVSRSPLPAQWKKSKLPFKTALKIGCSNFKYHPIRMIATVLLGILTCTLLGIALNVSLNKYENIIFRAMQNAGIEYSAVYKYDANSGMRVPLKDAEKTEFKQATGSDPICALLDAPELDNIPQNNYVYYNIMPCGYIMLTDKLIADNGFEVRGHLPKTANEIGLTRFNASILNDIYFKYDTEYAILNEKLAVNGQEYVVVCVVDTHIDLEKYGGLKNISLDDNERTLDNALTNLSYTPHNMIIVHDLSDITEDGIQTDGEYTKLQFEPHITININNICTPYGEIYRLGDEGVILPSQFLPMLLQAFPCDVTFETEKVKDLGALLKALYEKEQRAHSNLSYTDVYDKYKIEYALPDKFNVTLSDFRYALNYTGLKVAGFSDKLNIGSIMLSAEYFESLYDIMGGDYDALLVKNSSPKLKDFIGDEKSMRVENQIILSARSERETIDIIKRIAFGISAALALFYIVELFDFMSKSLSDRHKTIGILKANGCDNTGLVKIFVWESLIISAIVLTAAILFTGVASATLNGAGVFNLPIFAINAFTFLIQAVLTTCFAFAGCLIPIVRLKKVTPANCLRAL